MFLNFWDCTVLCLFNFFIFFEVFQSLHDSIEGFCSCIKDFEDFDFLPALTLMRLFRNKVELEEYGVTKADILVAHVFCQINTLKAHV